MSKITCDTCLDLMPLVKDGVASRDSEELVKEHIAECESCRRIYEEGFESLPEEKPDDKVIVAKIKSSLLFFVLTVILLGISMGMMITDSMNMFYNALIMPAIGCCGYLFLGSKVMIAPAAVFCSSFLWEFINCFRTIMPSLSFWEKAGVSAMQALMMGGIYLFFCIIGVLIGWAFSYAFRKD